MFPSPEQQKGLSLDNIRPVGVFRCPNCSQLEKENEQLKQRIADLEKILDTVKSTSDDNEV